MRRIIAVLSVMAIMAAMMVVLAMPAFAQGSPCGQDISGDARESGPAGNIGLLLISPFVGPGTGQDVAEFCGPAR